MKLHAAAIALLAAAALCVAVGVFGSPFLFHTKRLQLAGGSTARLRFGRLLAIGAGVVFLLFAAAAMRGPR